MGSVVKATDLHRVNLGSTPDGTHINESLLVAGRASGKNYSPVCHKVLPILVGTPEPLNKCHKSPTYIGRHARALERESQRCYIRADAIG